MVGAPCFIVQLFESSKCVVWCAVVCGYTYMTCSDHNHCRHNYYLLVCVCVQGMLLTMFALVEVENEENVLVCLRVIIDLHKHFKPPFAEEVNTCVPPSSQLLLVAHALHHVCILVASYFQQHTPYTMCVYWQLVTFSSTLLTPCVYTGSQLRLVAHALHHVCILVASYFQQHMPYTMCVYWQLVMFSSARHTPCVYTGSQLLQQHVLKSCIILMELVH